MRVFSDRANLRAQSHNRFVPNGRWAFNRKSGAIAERRRPYYFPAVGIKTVCPRLKSIHAAISSDVGHAPRAGAVRNN
jgi:hypothetical protein